MQDRFESFTVLMSKASREVRRIKTEVMSSFNLKSPHVSVIYYLHVGGAMTSKELCDICDEDKGALSRSIDRLEQDGYIVVDENNGKRYKSALLLTEKGMEVGKKISDKINFVLNEICIDLNEEQRVEFYRSLAVISNSLELCAKGIQEAKKIKTTKN
jgi:DNA-binding MarR family transcriptional regulator